ncbi:MAG: rane fusion protein multidrug efflux system [Sphingomonadales bacterium]|jgi:membrane fusion protein (multidrug efflux system)|nr:rane fusion protein multidrug efflux system [Sphingomonadales bacterium]
MKEGAITAAEAKPAEAPDAVETVEVAPPRKKRLRVILMLAVPLILLAVGAYFYLTSGRYVSTDNAYVQQDKVSVSALVTGPIVEVAVKENQRVKAGDLLFRIDPSPYRIALEQAEAQIASAQVSVSKLQAENAGTGADILAAQDNLSISQRNFERYAELLRRGFTTRVLYDQALHGVQEAKQRLANARNQAQVSAAQLRSGPESAQPVIAAAIAARDKALLDLKRTEVRAPVDGYASQTERLQLGNMAVQGLGMVTVVRSGDTWVEANFKETDLKNMAPGQPADIKVDAYSGKLCGHVASIGRGTGSEFSLLPAQNANGNWVKVTQRVPVRIAIDCQPARQLLAGLSVDVTVDTKERPLGVQPAPAPQPQRAAAR